MIKLKKNSLIIIFVFALLIFYRCSPNLKVIVLQYLDFHNKHDIENEISYLKNDIIFEAVDVWTKEGKDQIRNLAEYDAALNSELICYDFKISKDTVKCKTIEKNDWFRLADIDSVEYEYSYFIIEEGLIAKIIAKLTVNSTEEITSKLQSIIQWISANNPESLNELMLEGEFQYSKESAIKWLDLLKAWGEQ